jgi:hypothetical protein
MRIRQLLGTALLVLVATTATAAPSQQRQEPRKSKSVFARILRFLAQPLDYRVSPPLP